MAYDYFLNQADADAYFTLERLVTTAWDALVGPPNIKEKACHMAYNRLYYDDAYNLPTLALATPAQLVVLRKATGEMAYYMAIHIDDEDRRKGLQAQGVVEAGIVEEKYDKNMLMKVPIPPIVIAWLKPFTKYKSVAIGDIDRNENYSVEDDVTEIW